MVVGSKRLNSSFVRALALGVAVADLTRGGSGYFLYRFALQDRRNDSQLPATVRAMG
jgi:hypothetical protein